MDRRRFVLTAAALPLAGPACAQTGEARDHAAILGMAGTFRVRFDFRETTSFVPGYKPLEPKTSGGFEVVRVVEDRPGKVVLQHILVGEAGGETIITKHWRQDWVYEPKTVLIYEGQGRWRLHPVSEAQRRGAWSQTVWQTDDSPRYGGVGRWAYDAGVARWTSDSTARPLARRDAVRHPVYDRYYGTNRHALTPTGWVHEQDNAKVRLKDGKEVTYVHETVTNTYDRFDGFKVAAADAYWGKTKDYWAVVRAAWDAQIAAGNGVTVAEEPQMGSVTGEKLMDLADQIIDGKIATSAAVIEARRVIATGRRASA